MAKVAIVEACRFVVECLHTAGANRDAAEQQARLLIQADRLGHPGDGVNRLEYYVNDIVSGACEPNNTPIILKETASTAWVDAKSVLGATASNFAMDIAIAKAKATGVGWVVVKGSNHNGMAGFWAQKAAEEGLIGLAFTNSQPVMAPTRSKQAALGANPIAMVAPASCGESFYLDMSTTAVDLGTIDMHRRKGECLKHGWAQGPNGMETLDPEKAYNTKRLYPLGGEEETGGYKGYGLAAMVEVLCGVSAGSRYGCHLKEWKLDSDGTPHDIGHCFIAVNPDSFAPGFGDRLADCIQQWRDLDPVDGNLPVLAPGDKEKMRACQSDKSGTVYFVQQQMESSDYLAKRLKVKPMEPIKETC